MDRHQEIQSLLSKYRQGAVTPTELEKLFQWLEDEAGAGKELDFQNEEDRLTTRERMRQAVLQGIASDPAGLTQHVPTPQLSAPQPSIPALSTPQLSSPSGLTRRRWLQMTAVAAALILVAMALWLIKPVRQPSTVTISSEIGKIRQVRLPDESMVWLNDNTELVLKEDFAEHRTIEIRKGEAFFEVKNDKLHPFVVRSNEVNTVVLGTSFSVKLVPTDSVAENGTNRNTSGGEVKISVKTGKVLVRHQEDTLGFVQPLQRLRYQTASGKATRDSVLAGEADSWTRGELFLQNAGLDEVMQWISDHFAVTVKNEHHTYAGTYYLQAKADISLPQVLRILNLLGTKNHVLFTLKDQTIIIQ